MENKTQDYSIKEATSFIKEYLKIISRNDKIIKFDEINGNIYLTVNKYHIKQPDFSKDIIPKIQHQLEEILIKKKDKFIGFNNNEYVFPIKSLLGLIKDKYSDELKTKILDHIFPFNNLHDFLDHDKHEEFFFKYKKPQDKQSKVFADYIEHIKKDKYDRLEKNCYKLPNLFDSFLKSFNKHHINKRREEKVKIFEKLYSSMINNYHIEKTDHETRISYYFLKAIIEHTNQDTHTLFYNKLNGITQENVETIHEKESDYKYDTVISINRENLLKKHNLFFNTEILQSLIENFTCTMIDKQNKSVTHIDDGEAIFKKDKVTFIFQSKDTPIDKEFIKNFFNKSILCYEACVSFENWKDKKQDMSGNINKLLLAEKMSHTMGEKENTTKTFKI